jgi:CRISPR/Cas system-associated endonuclease Cas1
MVPKHGVLVLAGYGLHVGIEHGQLALSDGIGRERRTGRHSKATSGLKRLVILGHSGTTSFEALRWLHDLKAAVIQIDADGNVIVASSPAGLDDARLRRAQALAPWTGLRTQIARELLRHKIQGQLSVLERFPDAGEAVSLVRQPMNDLVHAETSEALAAGGSHGRKRLLGSMGQRSRSRPIPGAIRR